MQTQSSKTQSSNENSVRLSNALIVTYGLSIGTDLGDFERCNSPYFAFYSTEYD